MPKSTDKTKRSHLCEPCLSTITQLLQEASKQDNLVARTARKIQDKPLLDLSRPVQYRGNPSTGGDCYICTRTRGLISGVRILFEYSIRERSFRVFQSHIDRGFCFTIQKSPDFTLLEQRLRFAVDDTSKTFWSPTSIAHARKWLHTCLTKHPECTQQGRFTEPRQLPTRLLQVDRKDGEIKACLKVTSTLPSDIRYLTLSHRWGDNKFIVLTAGRLSRFLKRIPIDHAEFNQTFIDAMKITADIGYRYLWIDSLCIIQQDASDWEAECPRMGFIYLNGDCNLCANGVPGTDKAIMCDRNPTIHTPALVKVPNVGSRYVVHIPGDERSAQMHSSKIYEPPLFQRGWIVQEQVMAPRSLHFMEDKLAWVCSEFYGTDLWPLGVPKGWIDWAHMNGKNIVRRLLAFDDKPINSVPTPLLDQEVQWGSQYRQDSEELHLYPNLFKPNQIGWFVSNWYWHIAGPYTATQLTKSSDVLPALSGMATIFQRKLGSRYYAGHWESGLLESLLWTNLHIHHKSMNTGPGSQPKVEQSQSSRPYIAPTWSWASQKLNSTSKLEFPHFEPTQYQTYRPVSEVAAVSVTPTTSDRLGALGGGYITINGPASGLFINGQHHEQDNTGSYSIRLFNKFLVSVKIYADDPSYLLGILKAYYLPQWMSPFPSGIPQNSEIFLLPLTWMPQLLEIRGLLLLRCGPHDYVRAGKILISAGQPHADHYTTLTQVETLWATERKYEMRIL